MGRWVELAGAADLEPGRSRRVTAGDRHLALFNDRGELYAIDDTCPHQDASLADGTFHEGRVICPLHSWIFDVRTGRCPRETHEPVATYPVRVREASIEVELPD